MKKLWADFKKFITRGNVVDMAVGVAVASAFTAIVTAFTKGFISPLLAIITGNTSLDAMKWVIKEGIPATDTTAAVAPVEILWGTFLQKIIDFLIIALKIFAHFLRLHLSGGGKDYLGIRKQLFDPNADPLNIISIHIDGCMRFFLIKPQAIPKTRIPMEHVHLLGGHQILVFMNVSQGIGGEAAVFLGIIDLRHPFQGFFCSGIVTPTDGVTRKKYGFHK